MSDVKERRIRILRVQGTGCWPTCVQIVKGLVERGELPSDTELEAVSYPRNILINGQIEMRIRSQEFSPVLPCSAIPAIEREIPDAPIDKRITPERAFEAIKVLNPEVVLLHVTAHPFIDNYWVDSEGNEYRFRCHAGIAWPEGVTQWPTPKPTWRKATVDDVNPSKPKTCRFRHPDGEWNEGSLIAVLKGQYVVFWMTTLLWYDICEVAE